MAFKGFTLHTIGVRNEKSSQLNPNRNPRYGNEQLMRERCTLEKVYAGVARLVLLHTGQINDNWNPQA